MGTRGYSNRYSNFIKIIKQYIFYVSFNLFFSNLIITV